MTRRRFSERDVLRTLYLQGVKITCHRCGALLHHDDAEREHYIEIALGGSDNPENCFYSHKACHALITNGTPATSAGSSKHRIAKTHRLEKARLETARTARGAKMKSRGFQKPPPGYKRKWPKRGMRT